MGWLKKFKKALGLENKRKIPKQESKPAPKASTRKEAPKYSDRAPNVQKMKAKEAYRAKREVTAHKAVSSMSKGAKQTFKKNTQKSPVQRFNAGVIRNGVMLGLPSEKGMPKSVKKSFSYKAGKVVGEIGSYAVGYGAAGKAVAKGGVKIATKTTAKQTAKRSTKDFLVKNSDNLVKGKKDLATKVAKIAEEQIPKKNVRYALQEGRNLAKGTKGTTKELVRLGPGEKKVGKLTKKLAEKKSIKEAAEKAVKESGAKEGTKAFDRAVEKEAVKRAEKITTKAKDVAKQNLLTEATAGTVLSTTHAKGEGIELGTKEHAKEVARNMALGVGVGVGSEVVGAAGKAVVRGVRRMRDGKTVVQVLDNGKVKYKVVNGERASNIKPGDEVNLSGKQDINEATKVAPKLAESPRQAPEAASMRNAENRFIERASGKAPVNRSARRVEVDPEQAQAVKLTGRDVTTNDALNGLDFRGQRQGMRTIDSARGRAVEGKSTNVIDFSKQHDPARAKVMSDYVDSVDEKFKGWVRNVREMKDTNLRSKRRYTLPGEISETSSKAVKKYTDFDVSGYKIDVNGSAIGHTDIRHGKKGVANSSMSNENDVARLPYIINNADGVASITNREGGQLLDSEFTKDGKGSPVILFVKRVDGEYYAAAAVQDATKKRLRIKGVYSGKEEVARLMNMADNAPHLTPETPDGYRPSVPKTTISQPQHIDKKFDTDVVSEAINDTSFRRHLSKENISIRQYAKEHDMTNAEAITKLYNDMKDKNIIRNVKTPKGAEKELLGDEPARILTRRPEQKDPGGKIKSMWDTIVRHWVDDTHEISRFAKKADDDMIRPLLDRAKTSIQSSNEMVNGDRQMLILKDGVVDNGKSLKGILRPVMDRGEQYEKDFSEFLYHRMNASYRHHVGSDVFGPGMTAEKSGSVVREMLQKHPEFKDKADELYKYLDGLNRIEMDAGRMTREHYNWLKTNNPYYVPSYRQKYIDSGRGKVVHGDTISTRGYHGATGSSSDIAPLHEQIAFETQRRMEASALNDLGYRMMKDMGDDAVVSIKDMSGKAVAKDEILDIEKGVFPKTVEEKNGAYYFNVRGEGKVYQIALDKKMFDALQSVNEETKKIPVLNQANNIFRSLVTDMNPLFAVRNGARDFLDAPSFSQYSQMEFYKNYARAWKHIKGDSDLWRIYKSIGGTSESFVDVAKQWEDGRWFSRNVLQRIKTLNSAVEQAPRFAEFMTTLEHEGNSKEGLLKALNNAHELTLNFGRHGKTGKILNANGATFFNAGVQDLARIARVFANAKSNPGALARLIMGASVLGVAPSAINELVCGDMEGYRDLRTSEKDLNFLIPTKWIPGVDTDELFIKIPKGRVSSVFAMPVQRGIRQAQGNTKVGEKMLTGMGEDITEQIAPMNPLENNLLRPAMSALDKDGKTWYGAPIVPSSLQDKKPEDQTDENTTRLATAIGKATHTSPKRIDYVLKQYGGIISQAAQGAPGIGRPTSETKIPGAGILKSNFISDSNANNGYANTVYDKTSKLKMFKDDSRADKLTYDYMNSGQRKMSEFTKQIREIQNDKKLSAEEKNKKIRELRREQIKVAKQYLSNGEKAKDQAKDVAKNIDKSVFTNQKGEFSENKYNAALKEQLRLRLDGAKALVAEEDAKTEPGEKTLSQKLKEAKISPEKYYDYKAKGATLSQVKKAKERGIDVETYVGAMRSKRGTKSFGETLSKWIDDGYVKNFEDFQVFDPDAKKNTWNAIVWAKNHGMSSKKISKVIGTDTVSDQTNRERIKEYGTSKSGRVYTSDALHSYIESEHKGLSRKEKALMFKYYGYGYPWFQNRNPYL